MCQNDCQKANFSPFWPTYLCIPQGWNLFCLWPYCFHFVVSNTVDKSCELSKIYQNCCYCWPKSWFSSNLTYFFPVSLRAETTVCRPIILVCFCQTSWINLVNSMIERGRGWWWAVHGQTTGQTGRQTNMQRETMSRSLQDPTKKPCKHWLFLSSLNYHH